MQIQHWFVGLIPIKTFNCPSGVCAHIDFYSPLTKPTVCIAYEGYILLNTEVLNWRYLKQTRFILHLKCLADQSAT